MPIQGSQFLDPEILRQLPNMELIAKRLVESVFVGYRRSPYFGFSVEFADHREYVHGDDLRTVDWKVWARKNRCFRICRRAIGRPRRAVQPPRRKGRQHPSA